MRKRITVVGDIMIDVDHIVSESDEREDRPRLIVQESRRRLGTAGAVAQMVAALGVDVKLIGIAQTDDVIWIQRNLKGGFAAIIGQKEITARRERFYWPNWKIAGPRLDFGGPLELLSQDRKMIAGQVLATAADAVIVCDHAQGVVCGELMESLKAKGVPVFVDPHPKSDFELFSGVECLVLNREEALAATAAEPEPKNLINKMDEDGIFWYREGWLGAPKRTFENRNEFDEYRLHFPTVARDVVDTLGAGDQFIAALTSSRVLGDNWETAIMKANVAAGLQCERRGIMPVGWTEIDARLNPK